MKIKNLLMNSLLAGGLLLAAAPAQAQFQYPSTSDNPMTDPGGSNIYNVRNTGNDARDVWGKPFKVMTWDGNDPAFGWDWDAGSVIGSDYIMAYAMGLGTVSDPDVVVDPFQKGVVTITYELDNGSGSPEIWAESWYFNGSGMTFMQGPYQLDTPGNGPSSNPNIDTDINSKHAVITFEQAGDIFGHAYDMFGSGPSGNIFNVTTNCIGNTNTQPDVATYYDPGSGNTIVSFTFIHDNGSNKELMLVQEDLNDVLSIPASNCNMYFTPDALPNWMTLEYPRIAAPSQPISSDPYDVYIVADWNDGSADFIMGYSKYAGVYGSGNFGQTKVNDVANLYNCQNSRPALTYMDSFVIVAWTYHDSSCGMISGDDDILVRHLDYAGNYIYSDYSIANMNMGGDQFAASVAGRYEPNYETLYTFYDDGNQLISYKSSYFTNQNIRKGLIAAPKAGLTVYPMPVTAGSKLAYTIPKTETAVALELYTLTGQKVRSYNVSGKTEGSYELGFNESSKGSGLPAGMYLLRLSTNKATQATRVVIGN